MPKPSSGTAATPPRPVPRPRAPLQSSVSLATVELPVVPPRAAVVPFDSGPPDPLAQTAAPPALHDVGPGRGSAIPLEPRETLVSMSAARASDLRRASDADLDATADRLMRSMRGRDPEASLDVPPPSDVLPPEERGPGASDPYIGTTFDHRYKIQKLLGEGGMGFVYLARHKVIDKKVAVKVLRADLARDREILDRFLQEAKAASSIGNPHIVDISDFGDLPDGSTYFVMEYLEGRSLSHLVDVGVRLSVERICKIGLQIADGLSAAHAGGIVHRDLKPDNVYVIPRGSDPDFVKILDFGIAKVTGNSDTKLTKAGAVFGTPHYMSPEQAAGAPVDHRTDIYALGVMLYEMVSGQLPFNADNFMGILTQHMYKAPVPIRALVPGPDCPPSLEAVVLKCLSKKPEARYQSMDELAADLERVKSGGVPQAVGDMMARSGGFNVPADYFNQPSVIMPATPPTSPTKWPRLVWIAGAMAAVGLATTILVVGGTSQGTPAAKAIVGAQSGAATESALAAPASALVAKKAMTVVVSATPSSATVFRDDVALHQVPWSVEVEEGKPVAIEIRAEGFEPEKLLLDGSFLSKSVVLKVKKTLRAIPAKGRSPDGKPTKGGDVVDPWGKR